VAYGHQRWLSHHLGTWRPPPSGQMGVAPRHLGGGRAPLPARPFIHFPHSLLRSPLPPPPNYDCTATLMSLSHALAEFLIWKLMGACFSSIRDLLSPLRRSFSSMVPSTNILFQSMSPKSLRPRVHRLLLILPCLHHPLSAILIVVCIMMITFQSWIWTMNFRPTRSTMWLSHPLVPKGVANCFLFLFLNFFF
jgi:hypothetical protein